MVDWFELKLYLSFSFSSTRTLSCDVTPTDVSKQEQRASRRAASSEQ